MCFMLLFSLFYIQRHDGLDLMVSRIIKRLDPILWWTDTGA